MRERQNRARERVNKVCQEQGITKTFIAKQIGLTSVRSLYQWQSGLYDFSISRLMILEELLNKY